VSDTSQGPGWWQASDGKWYSPDQVSADATPGVTAGAALPGGLPLDPNAPVTPGAFLPGPGVPPPGVPPYGAGPVAPAYGAPAYGSPPGMGGYGAPPPAPGYGYPPTAPGYGYVGGTKTNGLAIASMVCSFFFWIYGIPALVAIVLGFVARDQIKKSNGTQTGRGMALTGIIVGIVGIVLGIVLIIVVVAAVHHCDQTGSCANSSN